MSKALLDLKAIPAILDHEDHKARRVFPEKMVQLDHKDHKVNRGHKAFPVKTALMVHRGQKVHKAHKDRLGQQVTAAVVAVGSISTRPGP